MVPPLDKEASGIITVSEEIIKAYASKHSLNARAINDLIKDVLKNPAFNADEVDTDMLKRLQASIDSGDIQIINMTVEGDGDQVLELFKRLVEKVLRELMADMRLAGHQHFAFHEYKDPRGNRLFLQGTPMAFCRALRRVGDPPEAGQPLDCIRAECNHHWKSRWRRPWPPAHVWLYPMGV